MSNRPAAGAPSSEAVPRPILVIMAMCGGFAPLAIDAYLPGLPAIAAEFGVSASLAQITLTGFLLSLGLMQLVIGPLSDQLGRRRLLLIGTFGITIASALCALAPNIWVLILARIAQGSLGAAGVVLSRAVVSDLGRGVGVARAFAALMSIQALAPIVAPMIGGVIVPTLGWRPVFWFLTAFGVLVSLAVLRMVPESLPPEHRRRGGIRTALGDMGALLRTPRYLAPTALFVLSFVVLFAYVSASPFVLQRIVGLGEGEFSIVFTLCSAMILVANLISGRVVPLVGAIRIVTLAALGLLVAVAWIAVAVLLLDVAGWAVIAGFILTTFCAGFLLPNSASMTLQASGNRSGTGSALMGAMQFLMAAIIAPLTGIGDGQSAIPMVVIMLTAVAGQIVALLVLRRVERD